MYERVPKDDQLRYYLDTAEQVRDTSDLRQFVANHVTVRKTVRHSLGCIYDFWNAHGVWPESTPQDDGLHIEYEGPTPTDLESVACTECGANVR